MFDKTFGITSCERCGDTESWELKHIRHKNKTQTPNPKTPHKFFFPKNFAEWQIKFLACGWLHDTESKIPLLSFRASDCATRNLGYWSKIVLYTRLDFEPKDSIYHHPLLPVPLCLIKQYGFTLCKRSGDTESWVLKLNRLDTQLELRTPRLRINFFSKKFCGVIPYSFLFKNLRDRQSCFVFCWWLSNSESWYWN